MAVHLIAMVFYSFKVFILQLICVNNLHSLEHTIMKISRYDELLMVKRIFVYKTNQTKDFQVINNYFSHSVTREARP